MGATAGKMGPQRDTYTLPKVLVIVDPGEPTAGTEGSIVNHAGFSPDIAAMLKWYVETFVAKPAEFGEVKIATLPGATLLFSSTDIAGGPHKSRALDHIGFEVKDLEDFSKNLEAAGVKFDAPFKRIPRMGFAVAFMCDLWGTRIELTERSARQ